jgi:pyruvate dehydrogenase E1 component alpha subunit/2-oxoisovalerate dehydrogenase E1 component alpha subunit
MQGTSGTADLIEGETDGDTVAPDLGLYRVLRDDGGIRSVSDPVISAETKWRAYREMKRIRLLDARARRRRPTGQHPSVAAKPVQEAQPATLTA